MVLNLHGTDDQLELYALGRLPVADQPFIEEHLLVCEACRGQLELIESFALGLQGALAAQPEATRHAGFDASFGATFGAWMRSLVRWPIFAGALAAAALAAIMVFSPIGRGNLPPVATLQLAAVRGDMPSVAKARETDLTLKDAPAEGAPFRVTVYDAAGHNVWNGPAGPGQNNTDAMVEVKIRQRLDPGRYFVRLYSADSNLLHEYGFVVR